MTEYTVFAKRVGLVGITNLIMNFRGLILLPILTKTLGAAEYGAWSQILVTVSLAMPFVMLGLPSAMVRFLPAEREKKNVGKGFFTVILIILFTSLVFALSLFLLSNSLATLLLNDISFAPIFKIASVLVILEALNQTSLQAFRILGQIKKYSILAILQTFVEVGLVSFFVLSGFGLSGAIISLLITRGFILLLSLCLVISHIGFVFPDFSVLRPYLLFGLPLIPNVVFEIIVASSDRYAIGFFMDAAAVGIYSAAYGIACVTLVSLRPILYILAPTVFKSYDEGKIGEVKTYLSYSLKYFLMFSIPSVFGLSILAKPLLVTLTTSEFVSSGIFIVPLVALSMIFEGVRAIYGEVLMLFKRTKIFGIASIIAGLINLVLNIALIPYFGIVAAAITTLISYCILGFIMYYVSRKYMKFELNLSFIIKSVLASAVMIFIIEMLNPIGAVRILLAVGIGAIVYFCVLFLLKGFKKDEIRFFFQFFDVIRGGKKTS
jgi:O-antigen/teichoic acid export membrane protein